MLSRTASTLIRRQSQSKGLLLRSFATLRLDTATTAAFPAASPVAASKRYDGASNRSLLLQQKTRSFSDSHDDFAPQKKNVPSEIDEAVEMIQQHVNDNPVMLYMKGNPSMPMCGFSAKIVQTLQTEGVDFASVNVLDYPSIREGVKQFASWPTIPQLYINGEFIGGNDIVSELHESGELKELLVEA
eukprot:CAMPEP_0116137098 /NCGR_PEP_ID=MMETSP0329-20121206/12077_1 /TAXON_ID=697910 /ORGANISM="Pseudo-nitzschia arenysensis, Strain B593" /LENGTH=186 /DNA_ID=CAMNT_0003632011 /DNA_START=62 /DNA_END=619 /DNA_ORIENTATION=-